MPEPYYQDSAVTIYHGDAVRFADDLPKVDAVISDPPYPNNAGHFIDGVLSTLKFLRIYVCDHWILFWDELQRPPLRLPLVAKHIWHRNNSNRPDNYEAIYHFHADGRKRASRIFSYPVIYPGLTGCNEANGHPTQKSLSLMQRLIHISEARTILDPFAGSGTTGEAAKRMGKKIILIELEERYCEIAARRMAQEVFDFSAGLNRDNGDDRGQMSLFP